MIQTGSTADPARDGALPPRKRPTVPEDVIGGDPKSYITDEYMKLAAGLDR